MNDWQDAEHFVERAHQLYEEGRLDEAESALREAITIIPDRAEWHFNLGLTLEAAGRLDDAMSSLERAHELDPTESGTLQLMGVVCLRLDKIELARDHLLRAMKNNKASAEPHIHLIEVFTRLNDHDRAEEHFYLALQVPGDHALAYASVAESLIERREYPRAIYCLREASSIDPRLSRVHARLAFAYAQTGRLERARQLYLRELRDSPGDTDTLLDMGDLLVDMNRLADAAEKYRRVLEIQTDNAEAHNALAGLAMRQHRTREATERLKLVLRLDPDHSDARRNLASILLDQGELAEARRLLRRETRSFRAARRTISTDTIDDLGQLLLDARLPKDAISVFTALIDRRPDDALAWHCLSVSYFQSRNHGLGMDACNRALKLKGDHVPALHNMTIACMQQRRWRDARGYLDRAIELSPDDHALRRLMLALRLYRVFERTRRFVRTIVPVGRHRDSRDGSSPAE